MILAKIEGKKNKGQWYLRYLPFIAKSQYMQVQWLAAECKKNKLANDELLPYVRLLFSLDNDDERLSLKENIATLSENVVSKILDVADIYIISEVVDLIPELNRCLTEVVLLKTMPTYEQKPQQIMDNVFYSINQRDGNVLDEIASLLMREERAPAGFQVNYERFKAILEDEKFIRTQWPSAK